MNPGDTVIAAVDIVTRLVHIPAGTVGIVEYAYPDWACVQFAGFLRLSNIELYKLRPARVAVVEEVSVDG